MKPPLGLNIPWWAGHKEVGYRLKGYGLDGSIGVLKAGPGLVALEGVEIEDFLLVLNGFPGEVLSCCLLQLLEANAVGGKEDERVGVVARTGAALLYDSSRFRPRTTRHLFRGVDIRWAKDHKPGIPLIRDLSA